MRLSNLRLQIWLQRRPAPLTICFTLKMSLKMSFCSAQVWSIFYRGWLTLMMLLWATITWICLNTRRNIIVVLIFAVGVLFVEYLYVVLGDEVLRKMHRSDSDRWSLYTLDDFPTAIFVKVNTKRNRQRDVVYSALKTNG